MVGPKMVALNDGSIAPIGARQAYASTTGRLNERRSNREGFLRRSPEARSRFWRRDWQLLEHETEIGGMVGEAARQEHFRFHSVAIRRAVRHLALVFVDNAGNENVVLK